MIVAASELNADFLRPSFCGACAAHDAGLEDEGEHHHAHSHGEHDPHVWLCREGAIGLARGICSGLVKLAPDKESKLRANLGALEARINALYDTMHAALDPLRGRKLLTFHEAWAYFADEFNFIIAATMTLSGRNVSLKARQRIDELIRSGDVQTIFVEPQFDATIARELAKETGVSLATLDPAEVTMDKLSPDCYFAAMERNLAELRKAFGLVKNEQPVGEIPAHGRDSRVVDKGRDSAFLRYEDSSCLCRRA